jgi:hypothetical protein
MRRLFFACGSLFQGGLVVVLGPFGAHTREARMTRDLRDGDREG